MPAHRNTNEHSHTRNSARQRGQDADLCVLLGRNEEGEESRDDRLMNQMDARAAPGLSEALSLRPPSMSIALGPSLQARHVEEEEVAFSCRARRLRRGTRLAVGIGPLLQKCFRIPSTVSNGPMVSLCVLSLEAGRVAFPLGGHMVEAEGI